MDNQSRELHNIQRLMDKVAAHQRLTPSDPLLAAESLANRTLSVYRAQGLEVDEQVEYPVHPSSPGVHP